MVKYFCDHCEKGATRAADMPRKVVYYATREGVKLSSFIRYENRKTHMCDECYKYIANWFIPVGQGDEDEL